ncbi:MAG: ABC transporter permease [Nocardioidaceae bacterium]|nr:ABC transporter permease [Nocardioidaceae bacterium]
MSSTDSLDKARPERASEFSLDLERRGLREAAAEWWVKVRSGEPGALPSIIGLIVLGAIFYFSVSSQFLSSYNLGTVPGQGAYIAVIALGLVFVLLLGEIDLSAGTSGGACATIAAVAVNSGHLHHGLPDLFYWCLVIGMVAAIGVAVWLKVWLGAALALIGEVLILTNLTQHLVVAMIMAICVGAAIGILNGVLVAKVGIPSFVATLALFLAWGGVVKFGLKNQPIGVSGYNFWHDLTYGNLTPTISWIFTIVLVVAYLGWTTFRSIRLARAGLAHEALDLVLVRGGLLTVVAIVVTVWAVRNRNPSAASYLLIQGIPVPAAIAIVLMIVCTLALTKTTWGRHLYATGGNAEAAHRAGIDVVKIKVSAFMLCSMFAALGGILLASYQSSVALDLGSGNVLLFSVAAAVIGGTSLFGGRGRPRDAILGALVITVIPYGLSLKPSIDPAWQEVITGIVLLLAASVDAISRRRAPRL